MASRRGSINRLPLPLPHTRSAPLSSTLPVVGFLLNRGKTATGKAGGKKTPLSVASSPPPSQTKAYLVVEEEVQQQNKGPRGGADLFALLTDTVRAVLTVIETTAAGRRSWALQAEKIADSAVINCRFFTLIPVAGTLTGSILCFVEGCYLIMEAFFEYFHAVWEKLDQGQVMSLLIEAVDMFLVGSAMLDFGMGLYTMFIGSRAITRYNKWLIANSSVARVFKQKKLLSCMEMQCISEAQAKLGHAVLTLIQAGVVHKFNGVRLTSGLDLACLAGAILVSSAGVFLLSRLHTKKLQSLQDKGAVGVS
uniref:UPF0271 protein BCAH187_A3118 n=1 Tax=Anthurium amnicola TaxID=1678845 RepID=A0A1D1YQI8_9ARAE